ncbi:MAG: YkvA family protein [Candidatus Fimivivens sp.]
MHKATNFLNEESLTKAVESHSCEAHESIQSEDKFERLVQRLEKILKTIPAIGKYASDLACMVSLVRSYMKKEYPDIPISAIVLIVSSIIYIVSSIDLIPDFIPAMGWIDDIAVIVWSLKTLHTEIEDYKTWRKENGQQIIDEI